MMHDEHDPTNQECDKNAYDGGFCTCNLTVSDSYDYVEYGDDDPEPSSHDGRLAGPALDW